MYDTAPSRRLHFDFAHTARLYNTTPHAGGIDEFLKAFCEMAAKAGFKVDRTREWIRLKSRTSEVYLRWSEDGEIAICDDAKGRNPQVLDLVWNPLTEMYEAKADDPASTESGYRKPKRSDLAVLAEAAIERLKKQ